MRKRKIYFIVILNILAIACANGQNIQPYFYLQHARSSDTKMLAMGYTAVAFRKGIMAPMSNPAGLSTLGKKGFTYTFLPSHKIDRNTEIMRQHTVSFALPVQNIVLGFYYFNLDLGKIAIASPNNPIPSDKKQTGIQQYQVSSAFNFEITGSSHFSIGLNLKYLHHDYYVSEAKTFLADIGLRSDFLIHNYLLSMGLAYNNIGGEIEYKFLHGGFASEEAVRLFKAGIALRNDHENSKNKSSSVQYVLSLEYQQNFNDYKPLEKLWKSMGYGLELRFLQYLYGRIGYLHDLHKEYHYSAVDGVTYGLGFETPEPINIIKPVYISLNYGRGVAMGLVDVNVCSVGLAF